MLDRSAVRHVRTPKDADMFHSKPMRTDTGVRTDTGDGAQPVSE
ncbi:hypothetical protein STRIP9103_02200 [Streptomyces ipomoeae 91-03]|uniref:Uncharacterized protein n=1 Tax=Streptomyces ipomoeae 91-03 TaxID=698759 RepID=L1KRL5_9ACTN|nr:hypothetical protein STRIP9103_02200 [Streptomyces ipomoeae 91-03]